MSEIIEQIFERNNHRYGDECGGWDEVVIVTNKQTITFGVSSGQSCCEDYGIETYDNKPYEEYVGAELKNVKWHHEKFQGYSGVGYGGEANFKIETSIGDFYVNIFNYHNGYYAHSYKVSAPGFNIIDEDELENQ